MRAVMLVLSVFIFIACSKSSDGGGNEGPGGGDVTAQKAAALAAEVYSAVRASPSLYPEVSLDGLRAVIAKARILVRERTFANGVETDATNDGVDLIELNRQRWALITEQDRRMALLFHELLGLMGLEKNNYFISSRMLSVKNRFAAETTYSCRRESHACSVIMKFDRTLNGFVVRDQNCGDFPAYPVSIFRRISDSVYSTNGFCPEPEAVPSDQSKVSAPCSIGAGDGRSWDAIHFMDGYEFFFTGLGYGAGEGQIHCHP